MGESERLGMLRAQDASPQPLPPGLAGLLLGPEIPPERAGEALALWQTTRRAVQQGAPFPDQDRLFFLTVLLAPVVDDRTRRAMLESALELLPDVRHRHVLRCSLAEHAVVAGDLEAARQWLGPCNPRPTDLRMDTAYRIAAACLAAAEGAHGQVIAQLGCRPGDVPLADDAEAKAELLRADAVERTQGPRRHRAAHPAHAPRAAAPRRVPARLAGARPLGLCPQSGSAATAALWKTVEASLRPQAVTSLGCLVLGSWSPWPASSSSSAGLRPPHAGLGREGQPRGPPLIWLVAVPVASSSRATSHGRGSSAYRDQGILTVARVVSSTRTEVREKSSSHFVNDISLQVLVGQRYEEASLRLTRSVPVALGVYPCLVDPRTRRTSSFRSIRSEHGRAGRWAGAGRSETRVAAVGCEACVARGSAERRVLRFLRDESPERIAHGARHADARPLAVVDHLLCEVDRTSTLRCGCRREVPRGDVRVGWLPACGRSSPTPGP